MMHFTSCLLFNIILIIYIFSYEWFYVRFYTQKCKLKMFTLNNGYLFLFRSRDNDVRLKFFCVIKRAVYSMFYLVLQSFSSSLAPWRHNSVLHAVFIVWQPQAMYTASSVQSADRKWWSVGGALIRFSIWSSDGGLFCTDCEARILNIEAWGKKLITHWYFFS